MLYDYPASHTFTPDDHGREQLQSHLDASLRNTLISAPRSVRELRLDHRTERTQTGLRYMAPALSRVCRVAAPGLSKVLTNIAGDARVQDASVDLFSKATACSIFNSIVDLRFNSLLSNHQLVSDEVSRTVEGFLGPKTHYLENATFLDLAEPLVLDQDGVSFHGASLAGRRLCVRYLSDEVVRTPAGDLRTGYSFVVTEAGDDAIRAYVLYSLTPQGAQTPGYFLMPARAIRQRQKRTGTQFAQRLRALLAGALRGGPSDMVDRIARLRETTLFPDTGESGLTRSILRITRRMRAAGMPADIAQQFVGKLLGRDNPAGAVMTDYTLGQLTDFDLFLSAMSVPSTWNQKVSELVEAAIFETFFGD